MRLYTNWEEVVQLVTRMEGKDDHSCTVILKAHYLSSAVLTNVAI